jgi:hypothetical protein
MKHLNGLLIALACLVARVAVAQDTNDLKTQIGWFETRTNVVIIKSYGPVGGIALGTQELSVRSKQTVDTSTGEKAFGLMIECESAATSERMLVDDDEIDSLINAVNYLAKINFDASPLPGFEASYTSKAGLRVIAHGDRRDGGVQAYVQLGDGPRTPLSAVQMSQLYGLLDQGRKSLAALKAK